MLLLVFYRWVDDGSSEEVFPLTEGKTFHYDISTLMVVKRDLAAL